MDAAPPPPHEARRMTPDTRRVPPGRRLLTRAALAATLTTLAVPALAHADSIVFVKDANVWLAKPDGSNLYQVTRDGTPQQPYSSPSQADDGTIAASWGQEIVRMRQNGAVLNRMDPPPLLNTVSHQVDGAPAGVAISPDGSKIVYSLVDVQCPIAVPSCSARPATAITPADHMAPVGNAYTFGSSWVTNTRVLTFAGYGHQVNTFDYGQQEDVHWFDDQDLVGQGNSTDQSDGEVNRQGTYVATIRGYGGNRSVMWLPFSGDVATGSRAAGTLGVPDPDRGCVTGTLTEIAGPTWSPSGTSLAWYEEGAIHVWDDVSRCSNGSSRPVIAGGSEPDWGPADINPGLREGEVAPPPPPGPPVPTPTGPAPDRPKTRTKAKRSLKVAGTVRLGAALRRGFRLRVQGGRPGKATFTAKLGGAKVASGRAKVKTAGSTSVTLRFTKAARRRLATRKRVVLKVTGAGASGKVTLKR
jgi:hypothetical protein